MGASPTELAAVRGLLRSAIAHPAGLCVLTGAGMSAESGIATFRHAMTGLWSRFDPADLASEAGFRTHPQRVWDWYAERRTGVRAAEPNAGHHALGALQARHPGAMVLVTQNVDDLHQRAGVPGAIRLHGDIQADRWLDDCARRLQGGMVCAMEWAAHGSPPHCADCGNLVRPGVVWFGEMLPAAAIEAAEHAARLCRLMLVVGTSGAVWPAAGLTGRARQRGTQVVIVNPEPSHIDDQANHILRGTAATLLPALLEGL